jgi:hypothetical protein
MRIYPRDRWKKLTGFNKQYPEFTDDEFDETFFSGATSTNS